MPDFVTPASTWWGSAVNWLLTYWIHSTVLLGLTWMITRAMPTAAAKTADRFWRAALLGGVATATLVVAFDVRPISGVVLPTPVETTVCADGPAVAVAPTDRATTRPPRTITTAPVVRVSDAVSAGRSPSTAPAPRSGSEVAPRGSIVDPTPLHGRLVGWVADHAAAVAVVSWALLACLAAVSVGWSRWRVSRVLADRSLVAEPKVLRLVDDLSRRADFAGPVRLTTSNRLGSPISFGRREICVPNAALSALSPTERSLMLGHELGHLVRRDPLWLCVAALVERVFFFQPLNRVARRAMQEQAEYVCDDFAVRLHGGGGIDLASCLARVASWHDRSGERLLAASMFNGQSPFVKRVRLLLDGDAGTISTGSRGTAMVVVGAVALGLVFFVPRAGGDPARTVHVDANGEPVDDSPSIVADVSVERAPSEPIQRPNVANISDGIVVYEEGFEPGVVVTAPSGVRDGFAVSNTVSATTVADQRGTLSLSRAREDERRARRHAERALELAERERERSARKLDHARQLAEAAAEERSVELRALVERLEEELSIASQGLADARDDDDAVIRDALRVAKESLAHALGLAASASGTELARLQYLDHLGAVRELEGLDLGDLDVVYIDELAELAELHAYHGVHDHVESHDHDNAHDHYDDHDHYHNLNDRDLHHLYEQLRDVHGGLLSDIHDLDDLDDLLSSDLSEVDGDSRATVGLLAVSADDDELLAHVLDAGDLSDGEQSQLLLRAIDEGAEATFDLLVERRVGFDAVDVWGTTPLHRAVDQNEDYMVEALLEAGVSIDEADENGRTALFVAAAEGAWESADVLLDRGADVNAVDDWDRTPLHYAAAEGDIDLVQLLVDEGATVNVQDANGHTPLHIAVGENEVDACAVLLSHGADPDLLDDDDRTAVDIADRHDHDEIVNLLLDHSREQR